ncbi:unnamed protein product [Rhodiola kirilowii]
MTPFEAVFGRKPSSILEYVVGSPIPHAVDPSLVTRDSILQALKANIQCAQKRMAQQSSVRPHHSNKLDMHFYGPFEIVARIGPVAYCLALPPHAKIHNFFQISLLRKCMDPTTAQPMTLPNAFIDFRPAPQPADILVHHRVKDATNWSDQLLVQWTGKRASIATWETVPSLCADFPAFDLEAKVIFDDGVMWQACTTPRTVRIKLQKGNRVTGGPRGQRQQLQTPSGTATELRKGQGATHRSCGWSERPAYRQARTEGSTVGE